MALVLAMKQGDEFSVGHLPFEIDEILSEGEFRLRCGEVYIYINDEPRYVANGVWMWSGLRGQKQLARICIEADKSKKIRRKW